MPTLPSARCGPPAHRSFPTAQKEEAQQKRQIKKMSDCDMGIRRTDNLQHEPASQEIARIDAGFTTSVLNPSQQSNKNHDRPDTRSLLSYALVYTSNSLATSCSLPMLTINANDSRNCPCLMIAHPRLSHSLSHALHCIRSTAFPAFVGPPPPLAAAPPAPCTGNVC